MPTLHYIIGDATEPVIRPAMIAHVNNTINGWGRGFVVSLSRKYPEPEKAYHEWFKTGSPQLGDVQFIQVKPDICVANMIAQYGIRWEGKTPPIRYDALEKCLTKVYKKCADENLTLTSPRIGAVLSGGRWQTIENIIKKVMTVDTYICTLEDQKDR